MQIGILGAGHIGSTTARLLVQAGHEVHISNARDPQTLTSLIASLGPHAQAATPEAVIAAGEVILLAIPWDKHGTLPDPSLFARKIVIDAMNRYPQGAEEKTSSEEVAAQLPQARIVKAFNTMNAGNLATKGRATPEDRLVLFVAGDDASAKAVVSRLIKDVGFAPVDTGSLREGGRLQQPGSPFFNRLLTGAEVRV